MRTARTIRTRILALLCAALLLALGCTAQNPQTTDQDTAVITVGGVPVDAQTYRYQLRSRYEAIERNKLYDRETYLLNVVSPTVYYPYAYYDTRTEEGKAALCADVLKELACEAASIYAAKEAGFTLSIEDQYYIDAAEQDAKDALEEVVESYGSADAFYTDSGFTEESFVRMYTRNREASIDYGKLLDAYREAHPLDEAAIEEGYARIVRDTFEERYFDGMYSRYLAYYIAGRRSYPSLYIPDDAIFVRLFVHTAPSEEQIAAYTELAATDFNALYLDRDNEYTAQGTAGDLAVAPKDALADGLYDAAKDVPIGEVGSMTAEQDGKTVFYLFLRVEGETGRVPIDRYPGVREMIVKQIIGAKCMQSLIALIDDPAITTRNEALLDSIRPDSEQGS